MDHEFGKEPEQFCSGGFSLSKWTVRVMSGNMNTTQIRVRCRGLVGFLI